MNHEKAAREAVARAWCHEKNKHKEMDADLALVAAAEVASLIRDSYRAGLVEGARRERRTPTVSLDWIQKAVVGSLRCAIEAHGPITRGWIGSAAKRVTHALWQRLDPASVVGEEEKRDE